MDNDEWYINQVIGKDTLNQVMRNLSKNANLQKIYTNHCIRASVVTNLNEEGFEGRHIVHITSHKSENSMKGYGRKLPAKKQREMFDTLSRKVPRLPVKKPRLETVTQADLQNAQIEDTGFDFLTDCENDELDGHALLEIVNKIEQENSHLFTPTPETNMENPAELSETAIAPVPPPATPALPVEINVQRSVQNVQNNNFLPAIPGQNTLPQFYFPHSTVTINYQIFQK